MLLDHILPNALIRRLRPVGLMLLCVFVFVGVQSNAKPQKAENSDKKKAEKKSSWTEFGQVRIDPKKKIIEVDGEFNLNRGQIEFLACAPGVKSHECLVSLDCTAENLQVALLLLGIKKAKAPKSETDLGFIEGDRVIIELRFEVPTKDGKKVTVTRRAEDLLINGLIEEEMAKCGWVFTGSTFFPKGKQIDPRSANVPEKKNTEKPDKSAEGPNAGVKPAGEKPAGKKESKPKQEMVFGASATGQFIAVSKRPAALLDNPLELPFPDGYYYAYTDKLPPLTRDKATNVCLIIRLPKKGEIDHSIKRMPIPKLPKTPEEDQEKTKP